MVMDMVTALVMGTVMARDMVMVVHITSTENMESMANMLATTVQNLVKNQPTLLINISTIATKIKISLIPQKKTPQSRSFFIPSFPRRYREDNEKIAYQKKRVFSTLI